MVIKYILILLMKVMNIKFNNLHLEFREKPIDEYDCFVNNRKYIHKSSEYKKGYMTICIVIYKEYKINNHYLITFNIYKEIDCYPLYENDIYSKYYEIVSKKQKIHESMEYKSLHLILQMIIGDNSFRWY